MSPKKTKSDEGLSYCDWSQVSSYQRLVNQGIIIFSVKMFI